MMKHVRTVEGSGLGVVPRCNTEIQKFYDNTPSAPVVSKKLMNEKKHWKAVREAFLVGLVLA